MPLQKSKACPFQITKGKNPSMGNATWKIPAAVPTGTYFIRSLVYMKNASDPSGLSDIPVAIGDSKGFFEVRIIETGRIPKNHVCSNFLS